jgi:tetratricopeptide (TPR) repeat protein
MTRKRAKAEFCALFRTLRQRVGLNQIGLGSEIGADRSMISKWENPHTGNLPSPPYFEKSCVVLRESGIQEDDLRKLEGLWSQARGELRGGRISSQEPLSQEVGEMLTEWDLSPMDRRGFEYELRTILDNWKDYQLAVSELRVGMHDFAREKFENLLERLNDQKISQPQLRMRILLALGIVRRILGEEQGALDAQLQQALTIARELGEAGLERNAHILATIGDINRRLGRLAIATDMYRQAGTIYNRIIDNERESNLGIAIIERKLGGNLLYQGRASSALPHLRKSMTIFEKYGERTSQIKTEQHVAWAKALLGNFEEALQTHERLLGELGAGSIPLVEYSKAKRFAADVLRMCGRLREAREMYEDALRDLIAYADRSDDEEFLVRGPILTGLGQTIRRQGDWHRAENTLLQSEQVNKRDPFHLGRTLIALGRLYGDLGKFGEADSRFETAEAIFTRLDNQYYLYSIKLNRADLDFSRENFADVIKSTGEIISSTQQGADHRNHLFRALLLRGKAAIYQAVIMSAVIDYDTALQLAVRELENRYLMEDAIRIAKETISGLKSEVRGQFHDQMLTAFAAWPRSFKAHGAKLQEELGQALSDLLKDSGSLER